MDKNSFEAQLLHTPFDKEDAYHSLSRGFGIGRIFLLKCNFIIRADCLIIR